MYLSPWLETTRNFPVWSVYMIFSMSSMVTLISLDLYFGSWTMCLSLVLSFSWVECSPCHCCLIFPFLFQLTLENILPLLLLLAWAMMQRNLHWLPWAMLFLLGIPLQHADIILLVLCLVTHKHCWWLHMAAFDFLVGWWCSCFCVVLDLVALVGSAIVRCLGHSTLGVWACWCQIFLCCHHQKSWFHLEWILLCDLHQWICLCLIGN